LFPLCEYEAWKQQRLFDRFPPKLVLMARADIADDAGFCFPSVFTLAAKVSMDQRSVQRILRKLTRRFLCVNRATIS